MTLAPETAAKLIELAEEKHLYLGSAPDTFLGSALQTARKAIDDGLIGEVTSFEACANRDLDLLASIFRFLRMPGGGICYDFGVYYLTAIVSLSARWTVSFPPCATLRRSASMSSRTARNTDRNLTTAMRARLSRFWK